jgi:hypothetical protein
MSRPRRNVTAEQKAEIVAEQKAEIVRRHVDDRGLSLNLNSRVP